MVIYYAESDNPSMPMGKKYVLFNHETADSESDIAIYLNLLCGYQI